MRVSIRLAERGDAVRLNAALTLLSADLGDPHPATDAMLEAAGWGQSPAFRAQLAEVAGAIVGVTMYSPVFSTSRGGAGAYVSDLWVAADQRATGLGRRLLGAVAADAARCWDARFLKLQVYDSSPGARRFYDRLGFTAATGHTDMILQAAGFAALKGDA